MALPAQPSRVIRFGAFELDAAKGELRKAGVSLKIHPQPFRVLLLLAEHPGQTITREEIQRSLWGENTFVDFERGINFCINQIRVALGDDAEQPRYVETLPRRGYRFVAPVTPVTADQQRKSPIVALTRKFPILVIGLIAATVAGGLVLRSRNARRLTEKDTIVLADFSNSTGDPVFDGTLRQGLTTQLEQSPFLKILSERRVVEELQYMGHSGDAPLTSELSLQVCERTGSTVVIEGSIASLGNQYVLGLKAVNCHTGDALANEQETAEGRERVLKALSAASSQLRSRLAARGGIRFS
jgi:DNA-binding winged helix-turn-helix (wHTH) protein